jgi:hypothetical protein
LAFAREVTVSNPLEDICVFLILARRWLYGRMGMGTSFARRGTGKIGNERTEHGIEKRRTMNGNDGRTGMVAEHGMTDYSCSLNK